MEIQNKPRIIISFMVEHISGTQGQLPMNFFYSYGVDCKTVRILAYSRGSQTKGLERG